MCGGVGDVRNVPGITRVHGGFMTEGVCVPLLVSEGQWAPHRRLHPAHFCPTAGPDSRECGAAQHSTPEPSLPHR